MTELEGASLDAPNESGETPTMNALASMVQSVKGLNPGVISKG